jgi:signal transduction histidine kinase
LTALSFAGDRLTHGPDERAAAVLRRGVSRMDTLIEDLLALSRIEAQTPGVTCDPSKVVSSMLEDWRPRVEDAGGTLEIDLPPAATRGGDGLLRQAVANLIDNALKYRRADVAPRIRIKGKVTTKSYALEVSDNGIGMSKEDARYVFEPFHRAARSSATPGTGLGLSIVKRIAESRGGRVSVASILDEGTTFTLEIPLAEAEE